MGSSSSDTINVRTAGPVALVWTVLPAALIVTAVVWLFLAGEGAVRPSADTVETVPVWHRWVPPLVGIAALVLAPVAPVHRSRRPDPQPVARSIVLEATGLVMLALVFAVALIVVGVAEPALTGLKLVLLVVTPLLLMRSWRSRPVLPPAQVQRVVAWPLVPILCWALTAYGTPLASPDNATTEVYDPLFLIGSLVVVFLINAVIEEFFYRRWLQSRLELIVGRAGGMLWAAVFWAGWHAAIQPVGRLDLDVAAALASHAVTGIFLGMLWYRYRRMWPLLVVHGAINGVGLVLSAM